MCVYMYNVNITLLIHLGFLSIFTKVLHKKILWCNQLHFAEAKITEQAQKGILKGKICFRKISQWFLKVNIWGLWASDRPHCSIYLSYFPPSYLQIFCLRNRAPFLFRKSILGMDLSTDPQLLRIPQL